MGDASNACRERSRERQSTRHSMIFVDIAKGRDTNDGSMSMPVLTVKRALQLLVELNPDEKVLKAQECSVQVKCGDSCKLLPCLGPQCTQRMCEQHGDGKGRYEHNSILLRRIVFQRNMCKEADCSVAFCNMHRRLISRCRMCWARVQEEQLYNQQEGGYVKHAYLPLVCRKHGKECRRAYPDWQRTSHEPQKDPDFSVRCLEGLNLASLSLPELMDRVIAIDPELNQIPYKLQVIQISIVHGNLVGISSAGEEIFCISCRSIKKEVSVKDLCDKVQSVLPPTDVVLYVLEGTHKLAASHIINQGSLMTTVIHLMSKQQLVQQLQDVLQAEMMQLMSSPSSDASDKDSGSDSEQYPCGRFCCPACYDNHQCVSYSESYDYCRRCHQILEDDFCRHCNQSSFLSAVDSWFPWSL